MRNSSAFCRRLLRLMSTDSYRGLTLLDDYPLDIILYSVSRSRFWLSLQYL
jgi:hypothetical protein